MTIKSTILKSISGSKENPQSWQDLTKQEKKVVLDSIGVTGFAALSLAVGFAVAAYEIKNTPEGCTAVIFPEQTFIEKPEHCHNARRGRSPAGLGF